MTEESLLSSREHGQKSKKTNDMAQLFLWDWAVKINQKPASVLNTASGIILNLIVIPADKRALLDQFTGPDPSPPTSLQLDARSNSTI